MKKKTKLKAGDVCVVSTLKKENIFIHFFKKGEIIIILSIGGKRFISVECEGKDMIQFVDYRCLTKIGEL